MKLSTLKAGLCMLGLSACAGAFASPVTYDFTATVTYDTIDSVSQKGQTITGVFTLNPTVGTLNGTTGSTGSNASAAQQVFDFSANLASGLFTTSTITNGYDVISGSTAPDDEYLAAQQGNGSLSSELDFGPLVNTLLDSNALLVNYGTAIAQGAAKGILLTNGDSNQLDFTFTSISQVPLPPALPLFGSALGVMLLMARKRSA